MTFFFIRLAIPGSKFGRFSMDQLNLDPCMGIVVEQKSIYQLTSVQLPCWKCNPRSAMQSIACNTALCIVTAGRSPHCQNTRTQLSKKKKKRTHLWATLDTYIFISGKELFNLLYTFISSHIRAVFLATWKGDTFSDLLFILKLLRLYFKIKYYSYAA